MFSERIECIISLCAAERTEFPGNVVKLYFPHGNEATIVPCTYSTARRVIWNGKDTSHVFRCLDDAGMFACGSYLAMAGIAGY